MSAKLIIGCGYLGRHIATMWRDAGERVFATTRSTQHADEFRTIGFEPIVCDITRPETLIALPHSVDAIVHCVGFDRAAGSSMRTVYVDGLAQVLTSLAGWQGRFVHVSSTSVYGQTNGELVSETDATEPADESGRVVLDAEQRARELRPDTIILRFGGIYGPNRMTRVQALKSGEAMVGDAEKWLNLIHVEDGARVVLAAIERGKAGTIYNVCDDRPVRRCEFYGRLAEIVGAPPPRFVPRQADAPVPPHERSNRRVDNRRMRRELGVELRYPTFEQGLAASF